MINDGQGAQAANSHILEQFLETCLTIVDGAIKNNIVEEPMPLTANDPQYDLLFDNNQHY